MNNPTAEQLRFILESCILAPSADNHHCFRLEVENRGVNLWYTPGLLPPEGGYRRALILLSLGAVFENLSVAANRYGFNAAPIMFPRKDKPNLIFRAIWEYHAKDCQPLWEEISHRHTNRDFHYSGPGLSEEVRNCLEYSTDQFTGCKLTWLDEPRYRRSALRLIRLAEGERYHNKLLHKELFGAIRFDVGWRKSCNEGLPPGALAIETPLQLGFSLLRYWWIMRIVNLMGGYRLIAWRAADLPCRLAPHLAVISGDRIDDPTVFRAGQALQRIWLEITAMGMVLQPMPASALYALEGSRQEGIPAYIQQNLQKAWNAQLKGRVPLMIFRLGRSARNTITTERKPLEDYLLPISPDISSNIYK